MHVGYQEGCDAHVRLMSEGLEGRKSLSSVYYKLLQRIKRSTYNAKFHKDAQWLQDLVTTAL